jgi:hypothetical protein
MMEEEGGSHRRRRMQGQRGRESLPLQLVQRITRMLPALSLPLRQLERRIWTAPSPLLHWSACRGSLMPHLFVRSFSGRFQPSCLVLRQLRQEPQSPRIVLFPVATRSSPVSVALSTASQRRLAWSEFDAVWSRGLQAEGAVRVVTIKLQQ